MMFPLSRRHGYRLPYLHVGQVYEKNLHDTMAEFPELRKQRRRDYYR